jgi:hypothetical protein
MRLTSICGIGLLLMGCATNYELPTPPPAHPANLLSPEPVIERSQTLAPPEPVDPKPARSEHWARHEGEDEAVHEHGENEQDEPYHDHGHDHDQH